MTVLRTSRQSLCSLLVTLAAAGCERDSPEPAKEVATARKQSGLLFEDCTEEAGLGGFRQVNGGPEKILLLDTVGGGVALFDCDQDGDQDIYLTNGSTLEDLAAGGGPADALYLNDGKGHFTDRTEAWGMGDRLWSTGARVADYDGDAWPDLYLTNYGPNVLYHNRGGLYFEDVSEAAGVADPGWSTGAAFLDGDQDGDLDLYVANYVEFDAEDIIARGLVQTSGGITTAFGPRGLPGAIDRYYLNQGDGSFRDASDEVGITGEAGYGFQVLCFDYDQDGWLDIYVANDSTPNLLWKNDGTGKYVNAALRAGVAFSGDGAPQAGMGVATGDYNHDLLIDLFVTNFAQDSFTLYRGEGRGFFRDVTSAMNLRQVTWSSLGWGCGFSDFDNDGDQDLYAVNGHIFPQVDLVDAGTTFRQRNLIFENLDGKAFVQPEGGGGPGFDLMKLSRGSAVGDVDGDGDLDLLIGNSDDIPTLLCNIGETGNHWIKVDLIGQGLNRDAVGARVVVNSGGRRQLQLFGVYSGFLSTSDRRLHFGMGSATVAGEIEITWPDGMVERVQDQPAGHVITIERGRGVTAVHPLGG
ncbi:MAG: CRTAC1 family protein [Planctomycetota bacterium]